ncbi:MAG: hypothetical protein RL385_158 [Pseudomonadota bacterium]|jgi:hypothetical protein
MPVTSLAVAGIAGGLFLFLLVRFDAETARRYGHRFLTLRTLFVHALALAAWACAWTSTTPDHATAFGALAAGLVVAMAAQNIVRTDQAHGAMGTLMQLLLTPMLLLPMLAWHAFHAFLVAANSSPLPRYIRPRLDPHPGPSNRRNREFHAECTLAEDDTRDAGGQTSHRLMAHRATLTRREPAPRIYVTKSASTAGSHASPNLLHAPTPARALLASTDAAEADD